MCTNTTIGGQRFSCPRRLSPQIRVSSCGTLPRTDIAQVTEVCAVITLYQSVMHMSRHGLSIGQQEFIRGDLILGVILQYMVSASFSCFLWLVKDQKHASFAYFCSTSSKKLLSVVALDWEASLVPTGISLSVLFTLVSHV